MDQGTITNHAELNEFLERVGYFHDGVIREIHWVNDAYVNSDYSMLMSESPAARILIQTQWEYAPAVELSLFNVILIHLDVAEFVYAARANAEGEMLCLDIQDSQFLFESAQWRIVDWMGDEIRFGKSE
jgi:hypothetical protein